jgi:hypothetical protein
MVKEVFFPKEKRNIFRGILILNQMINQHQKFHIMGTSDVDKIIEPLMIELISKELVKIQDVEYIPTEKGRENLLNFYKKYWEFVKIFQVYSAVDLKNGVFAYSKYWDMDQYDFDNYLNDKNIDWEDVRIAVAEFKKIDPVEIVFMSFLSEGRFNFEEIGWQFDLMDDAVYDEIIHICSVAIHADDLKDDDIIQNIIIQGSELLINLLEEEKKLMNQEEVKEEIKTETTYYVEEVVETYYEPVYYQPYVYDPFYISPVWLLLLI